MNVEMTECIVRLYRGLRETGSAWKRGPGLFGRDRRSGQTLVEYALTAVVLVGAIAICAVFLYTFKAYAGRVLDLVASEYP